MLGQHLDGVTVLDAFGGSGLITFESISRGAVVTTVEKNRSVARQIQAEADQLQVQVDLRISDARSVASSGVWDVVFMDPPYADDPVEWANVGSLAAKSVLIVEHRSGADMPSVLGAFAVDRSRRHGDSVLTIYRCRDASGSQE